MDAWDWLLRFDPDDLGDIPRHTLCDTCLIPGSPQIGRRRHAGATTCSATCGGAPATPNNDRLPGSLKTRKRPL